MRIPETLNEFKEQEFITESEYQKLPVIIGGDFNHASLEKIVFDTDFTNGILYKSAYFIDNKNPEFTKYKI